MFIPKVPDPYRWLGNPGSNETRQFIKDQNQFSQPFLSDDPVWPKINEHSTSLWNYSKFGLPQRRGKYYITLINNGLQNH